MLAICVLSADDKSQISTIFFYHMKVYSKDKKTVHEIST